MLDGVTLTRGPADLLLTGPGADIDLLIGWTREEAAFAFALSEPYAAATKEQVLARARDTFGARAAEAYTAYEEARPGARPVDVLMDLIGDDLFRMPGIDLAERRAARGRRPGPTSSTCRRPRTAANWGRRTVWSCRSCSTTSTSGRRRRSWRG